MRSARNCCYRAPGPTTPRPFSYSSAALPSPSALLSPRDEPETHHDRRHEEKRRQKLHDAFGETAQERTGEVWLHRSSVARDVLRRVGFRGSLWCPARRWWGSPRGGRRPAGGRRATISIHRQGFFE
jgi:hypothetical protein